MLRSSAAALLAVAVSCTYALRYDSAYTSYNLNQNKTATDPTDYWGEWSGHDYFPSPKNWRFPVYTLFLDRFVNGDPTNDDINGTHYEHDLMSTQFRHGGDTEGLIQSLDYLQGMGVKALYIAGSPFMNQPWGADQYSPLDFTLLDMHLGTIKQWREMITEVHNRNMYVILDNTLGTMGDLIGFQGYMNASTPFTLIEHKVQWKSSRHYHDFEFGNTYEEKCNYPRFWNDTGYPVSTTVTNEMVGCYDSDFDQYGDTEAFGVFPDYQRQLSKFASVQDRLREWKPSVMDKIKQHSCIAITMLDFDGFRFDKATQVTVDAQADFMHHMRDCAKALGKDNFFLPGEITGGNTFGSIYLGRGRQPDMQPATAEIAVTMTNESESQYFIRDQGYEALDGAAFHYTVYRSLTRFLGMDGNLASGYDTEINWVDSWNTMLLTNDMVNANTGKFDPRHMYGATNQDVFRWPAITNGTNRMLLGLFITTIHQPGIPLLLWGEDQAFYLLDNTASNYLFGRQPMSPATAWQTHGCYHLGSSVYYKMPLNAAKNGCNDNTTNYDHRDPSHPVRNIIKRMYQIRDDFPVINDGWYLQKLSNQTEDVYYPGSGGTATVTGIYSVLRSRWSTHQDFDDAGGAGNQSVWLLYTNLNRTKTYTFDCTNNDTATATKALIAPFDAGTTVKNLFYPYDEKTLVKSATKLGLEGSEKYNGCLDSVTMDHYEFRAYVPVAKWVGPPPMVTKFYPGHDHPFLSNVSAGSTETVDIVFGFNTEMNCDDLTSALSFNSSTEDGSTPSIDSSTITCGNLSNVIESEYAGGIATTWTYSATLKGVANGVHRITINNATTESGDEYTNAVDHFFFRIGQADNPIVFPRSANYTRDLLHQYDNGSFYVSHKAPGADKWRYSLNWGSTYSTWMTYTGGNDTLEDQAWSGTSRQKWSGDHVIVQYWSKIEGSSDYFQHADLGRLNDAPRRFPHLFWQGPYNQYGYDSGLANEFKLNNKNGRWEFHFMWEWPAIAQINVWGMNPDGEPDQTNVLGDADEDSILDRLPPSSLTSVTLNITAGPPKPYLAWKISIDDGSYRFQLIPQGNRYQQMALYCLLWITPVLTGAAGIWAFMKSFYQVKFNQIGVSEKRGFIPLAIRRRFKKKLDLESSNPLMKFANRSRIGLQQSDVAIGADGHRRMVIIATMEYDIEDWAIKIKIGGLGVMAQLMGKNLGHQDLIWVVPCVGGIDYPVDEQAEPMSVTILGNPYEVQVQYHTLRNITYVLLDAPVFRQQSKSEPYPARMDDLDSAIYYSAWNQCVALAVERFPVDLYHINDYHGSLAPLYLLPKTIPVCLSLHNAEFQGLWPMRSVKEREEVCSVFNLEPEVAARYVQFGEVFNLLHAGASYLRIHQQGFGAVGVSAKYGKRSYARYPIFWGLKKIGKLPNPDPSDTGEWNKELPKDGDIKVDPGFEADRGDLRRQAQEWAGLNVDPSAELFVFVGRWSMQKGVDLIADVFPTVLEAHPKVQVIAVGPVIDLYGKFAALKLSKLMELYPGRVFSKPEFTALPPYIFSGAEFALIPSRDEPFGLVAVEFGRKGALGVGARVGGLGQMPGWWYTVESTTTTHLLHQFKLAIDGALASDTETRAMMRARSAKQRFPVAQWVEDLEILQGTAIRIHDKEASKARSGRPTTPRNLSSPMSGMMSPNPFSRNSSVANLSRLSQGNQSRRSSNVYSRAPSPDGEEHTTSAAPALSRTLSLGVRAGPGHLANQKRGRRRIQKRDSKGAGLGEHEPDTVSEGIGMAITDIDEESDGENYIPSYYGDDEYAMTNEEAEAARHLDMMHGTNRSMANLAAPDLLTPRVPSFQGSTTDLHKSLQPNSPPSLPGTPGPDDGLLPPPRLLGENTNRYSSASVLSLDSVVGAKKDFKLQQVDPFFTDSTGEYYKAFEKKLETLDAKNSENLLCIEDYLVKSEKKWFDRFRDARLGRTPHHHGGDRSPASSIFHGKSGKHDRSSSPAGSIFNEDLDASNSGSEGKESVQDQFLLGDNYRPPTGLKKYMQVRIAGWPVYSLFLSIGQIIAASSYQINLLCGTVGETAIKLYILCTIYAVTSIMWWFVFRRFKSVYILSIPWFFYGLAFMFIGLAHFVDGTTGRGWMQNVGTGIYAVASSSGSVFFALNFGDEGGAPIKDWVLRACLVQGTQSTYVVALWYWGNYLTEETASGVSTTGSTITSSWIMTAITVPIGVILWAIGILCFLGLPDYYRQTPGAVPSFYHSLFRRKIVSWFFVYVLLQNFWLSAPYGRNWSYLWSSDHAKAWQILLLVVFFFGFVWAAFLYLFFKLSKDHSWILPVFAIGLGAPRWCQMLWGTSSIGQFVPWAGGRVASALIGRSLWLWLGVLDTIQGVGFGMILLQTLTRIHICFTLLAAQVVGSIATIMGRAFAPDKIGPGDVFPDFSAGVAEGLSKVWFWVTLICQLAICGGFFLFFRKEQLSKP
ncbi:MAG: Cell wall alpha-1,3-glucan synthase ags1 [Cirrosporium novae-zelandiae]|nr:MAG: Cell wall alpha-1,3-glucan synthase ags1 [Cirrosporium novae-zelandiae]